MFEYYKCDIGVDTILLWFWFWIWIWVGTKVADGFVDIDIGTLIGVV